jgi:hypothetical protein
MSAPSLISAAPRANGQRQSGLDRALFLKLATFEWLRQHHYLVVVGPTGPVT